MHLSEKSGSIIFWENFFFDFCSIYCVTSNAAHPETDTLLVGGGGGGGGEGWKCTYKNTIFQACSGIVFECRIFSTFWVTTFPVTPVWISYL